MLVTLDAVSYRYRRTRALDGFSAQLGPGTVGLLGPNGAGKSTLLRIVSTLTAAQTGSLRYSSSAGEPLSVRQVRSGLGYLPQDFAAYRTWRAVRFVEYMATLKGVAGTQRRACADAALDAVGLADRAGDRIGSLSGGSQQRVGIAQAIVGDPALLVLDEPTAGLDPAERIRFRRMVEARPSDRTVVISTHLVEDVQELCQSVIVIDGGVLRFAGTPAELRDTARGQVWRAEQAPTTSLDVRQSDAGGYRYVGPRTITAVPVEPTLEDGYLVVTAQRGRA